MPRKTEPPKRQPVVLDLTSDQCVWAAAGVIPARACHNAFDCTSCSLDTTIQRKLETGRLLAASGDATVSWRAPSRYATAAFTERPCRHMLSGAVPVKYCTHNFECETCPYDQMLEDAEPLQAAPTPELEPVAGFTFARRYYLARNHLWVSVEYGGHVRIGLDDFAARLLGPPDALLLPRLGATLDTTTPKLQIQRGGRVAAVPSPIRGIVLATNPTLETTPGAVHDAPYGAGWLLIVEPTHLRADLKALLFGEEALAHLDQEAQRLAALLHEEPERAAAPPKHALAATGGEALRDIVDTVPGADWDLLVQTFLNP